MPKLEMRTQTVNFVDSADLDTFINESYGFQPVRPFSGSDWLEWPFSFVVAEECGNDTDHTFNVTPTEHAGKIADWISSNANSLISTHEIMDNLCFRGLIEPGTYVVQVSW